MRQTIELNQIITVRKSNGKNLGNLKCGFSYFELLRIGFWFDDALRK